MTPLSDSDLRRQAALARAHVLRMVAAARASHVGTCLSAIDILTVLYGAVMRVYPADPAAPARDRFLLSKGHGAAALYATLALRGFFPEAWLAEYGRSGSPLLGHASHHVPGVELSTGSLGHGLPVACGLALASRSTSTPWRTYVLLSDGELDEGSNWEASLFAGHHRLDNLVAIIDANGIQSFGSVDEVLALEPLAHKWAAFGWSVKEVDGHDVQALTEALGATPWESGRPSCLIARTTKGKGVSFMEGQLAWHYRSPDPQELALALDEVGVNA